MTSGALTFAHPWALLGLGDIYLQRGDHTAARTCFAESLMIARQEDQIAASLAALAGLAATAVFAVAALWVHAAGGGLVALWLALSLWMAARFVTLTLRARGTAWLVTGAVRR